MKKNLLSIIFALISTLGFSQAPNYVPANGLVGWWPFNGNADDESGNGNNGSNNGATLTTDRNGVANQAYSFDVNQKIGTFITNFPVYTVSIWAKINTWNFGIGTFNGGSLASHKSDGYYGNGWVLEHNGENQNQWCWLEYNGNNNNIQQYSGSPQLNTWYHVILTSDSQGIRKLYINGVLTDTYNGGAIISGGNNYEFKIGAHIDGPTIWWFKGDLDDVGYWNRALAECEIQNLYTSSIPTNTTTASACDSYTWNGTSYTASGVYAGNTANCVTESLNLTITPSSTNTTTATACNSYTWNGTTYSTSGTYTGTTANCVTESLNLTITPSSTNTTASSACESYVWNGTTYTISGVYLGTTTNCVTQALNLTIIDGTTNTTTATACDNYTWNGQTYTQSGVYTGATINCVTQFLNLTITPSSTITQPASQSINISNNAQFIVGSSGSNAIYQWQTDLGIGFQNLNSVGQYSGTSNNTLTVSNVTFSNNNQPFRCIVSSGSCTDTSDVAVLTVVNNAGINDLSASKLSIFPNPTNGDFTITGLELVGTVSSLSLTDMNGKVVKVLDTKATKFSMASIKPGVYFLNIISGNKQEVLKIVKE